MHAVENCAQSGGLTPRFSTQHHKRGLCFEKPDIRFGFMSDSHQGDIRLLPEPYRSSLQIHSAILLDSRSIMSAWKAEVERRCSFVNNCAGSSSKSRGHSCACAPCAVIWESSSSSPVKMLMASFLLCMLLLAAISLCSPFAKGRAYAATWPVPTSELSASIGFNETYSAGDKSYVHSGIDIPASAGMQISSPLAGTVRFTGAVPSGDSRTGGASDQKTMLAVSIELQDGHVITLMPFACIDVHAGENVVEGERLGTLAESGDISSSQPHLHMGLKEGRRYLDPLALFGITAGHDVEEEASLSESVLVDQTPLADTPTSELSAEAHAWQMLANEDEAVVDNPSSATQEQFGTIESGSYEWHQQAERPFSLAGVVGETLEPLAAACADQAQSCVSALGGLSRTTGIPVYMLATVCAALALAAAFALLCAVLYLIGPRVRVMWRNRKSSLSVQDGGDSMHKLFPASGTAFISRSRMSPREVTK